MIILADLHMGKISDSVLVNGEYSRTIDTCTILNEMRKRAEETEQTIVIAGDVFNKVNPTTRILSKYIDWLSDCKDSGVRVIQIPGNHDSGVDWQNLVMISSARLDNVITICDPCNIEIENRVVHFLPHIPLQKLEQIREKYGTLEQYLVEKWGKVSLIISHAHVRGVEYTNDIFFEAGSALSLNVKAMPDFKLMVLGHIHKHMVINKNQKSKLVLYPGSTTVLNFGEVEDEKGFIEVDSETLNWDFHPFESEVTAYQHIVIDLLSKSTLDLDNVREVAEDTIVKITVHAKDMLSVNETEIRKAFDKWGHVARFETVLHAEDNPDLDIDTDKPIQFEVSHKKLLREYIDKKDLDEKGSDVVKNKAYLYGKEILEECLNA